MMSRGSAATGRYDVGQLVNCCQVNVYYHIPHRNAPRSLYSTDHLCRHRRRSSAQVMPSPFGMFGSDAASAPASTPQSRSASPAQTSASPALNPSLRRPASHGRLAQLMVPGIAGMPGRTRSSSTTSHEATTTHITVHADDTAMTGRTTPEQRRRSARGESPVGARS